MSGPPSLRTVMYHYVREADPALPHFLYLDVENFRRQLDWLQETSRFISLDEFLEALTTGIPPENGCLLTFDDGLRDHFDFVLPELEHRGLWGFFFVPTGIYETRKMLDVHRVHCLLGKLGGERALRAVRDALESDMIVEAMRARFASDIYADQGTDSAAVTVKKILNYSVSAHDRTQILDRVFTRHLDEAALFEDFYLTPDMLCDMQARGQVIGSHSRTHPVMSSLSLEDQKAEIDQSFRVLESMTDGLTVRTYCHPYGHPSTFNKETERLLAEAGCQCAFQLANREILKDDLQKSCQALPRLDCNRFPFGQVSGS